MSMEGTLSLLCSFPEVFSEDSLKCIGMAHRYVKGSLSGVCRMDPNSCAEKYLRGVRGVYI